MEKMEGLKNLPEAPVSLLSTLINKTGSWRNIKPVFVEKTAPCTDACPAHILIPHYIDKIIRGTKEEAAEILLQNNPFPSITGRVCPHFCETKCNREEYDAPVSIREIERNIGDYILEKKWQNNPGYNEKNIAVVGSGPAGLSCAHYLRNLGYKVVIFEKDKEPGGVLTYGIPEYRLPKEIVKKEIEALKREGVEIKTETFIGKDFTLENIQRDYDAVFLGTGAILEREMNISGEEYLMEGLSFLRNVLTGKITSIQGKFGVVGGGNVAMDVARTLFRLGAEVYILYRRTEKEMPAIHEEIEKAKQDGVIFDFLTQPLEVKKENNKLVLKCIKMRLGEPDTSGRRRPVPVEGSEFEKQFDGVIKAVGEIADMKIIPDEFKNDKAWIAVDNETLRVKASNVFAGGDLVLGPATVVEAIAAGKRAAYGIHKFLGGEILEKDEISPEVVDFGNLNLAYFTHLDRVKNKELPVSERVKGIKEEESKGITEDELIEEANRCFSCGHCNGCGNCWVFCPDMAVKMKEDGNPEYIYDYCKGCAICNSECPRYVISLVKEREF